MSARLKRCSNDSFTGVWLSTNVPRPCWTLIYPLFIPAGGRRHRRLHCRPPGGRNRGGLVQKRPVHPVGHLGGVVGLSPKIEEGHAEVGRQLVLLVLGGGLAARLKLFNRRAGEAQGGGKSRTAQAPGGPQLLNALCQSYHKNLPPC